MPVNTATGLSTEDAPVPINNLLEPMMLPDALSVPTSVIPPTVMLPVAYTLPPTPRPPATIIVPVVPLEALVLGALTLTEILEDILPPTAILNCELVSGVEITKLLG